ncbi:hypothetical protein ACRN9G_00190 [Shewanella frigidimarina]|uniref:hypothetical protein n=1 Tax=Shewanella frigidimarina TaxID=56812 RepID=UPI003D7C117C
MSELITIIASLIALLSALYARWTWSEAQKANKISRLNMLLALKQHYSELMLKEHEKARAWGKDDSYAEACRNSYADYQIKYRETSKELENFHARIVADNI